MRSDTTPAPERDLAAIWEATLERVDVLLRSLPDGCGNEPLPTVPGATVRDGVAHLARALAALGSAPLTLPSPGTAQSALTDLIADVDAAADSARPYLRDPSVASALVTAITMAEHDLRTVVNTPGARDDVAIKVALDELAGRFSDRVSAAGLPALRVTVEQWGTIAGNGRATSCVVADRFEFVRAMAGRRSASEIRRWNWGVEPDIYLPVMSEVGLPHNEIRERDPRIPEHMQDREFVL
ncbi:hypothetical protein OG976_09840 [Mycobacterium sp. NBC_00419]|uniref:hypothetical protein n=1 Tax=Mycobacterium sp. NBC_00419 TaxID=2975989 RepID=UPI002E1A8D96